MNSGYEEIGSDVESTTDQETFELHGKLYKISSKRWILLLLVSFILMLDIFNMSFFGFINDVTADFFKTDPAIVDILTAINHIARAVFGTVVCFFSDRVKFRNVTILTSGIMIVANALITIGVSSRSDIGFVMFGQVLTGASSALTVLLVQLVAMNWFPKYERGRAVAFPFVARRITSIMSSAVATRSMGRAANITTEFTQNLTDIFEQRQLINTYSTAYVIVFGVLLSISFLCCVTSWMIVSETPPEADGSAQSDNPSQQRRLQHDFKEDLRRFMLVWYNRPFVSLLVVSSFVYTSLPMTEILLSSIFTSTFPGANDEFAATIFMCNVCISSVGSAIAGYILDRYDRPRLMLIALTVSSMVGIMLLSLGLSEYVHSLDLVIGSILLIDSTRYIAFVCITHRIVAVMTDQPFAIRLRAVSLTSSLSNVSIPISTFIVRFMINKINVAVAVCFPLPFNLICVILYVFCWSQFRSS